MFNNYLGRSGTVTIRRGCTDSPEITWLHPKENGDWVSEICMAVILLCMESIFEILCRNQTLLWPEFSKQGIFLTHVLKASKGNNSSFISSGIWSAKQELYKRLKWILGSGNDIIANKDPWLRKKVSFRVDQNPPYEGRNKVVSSSFLPD